MHQTLKTNKKKQKKQLNYIVFVLQIIYLKSYFDPDLYPVLIIKSTIKMKITVCYHLKLKLFAYTVFKIPHVIESSVKC